MELDVAAKVHSGTIKDSTLCGMSLDDFYKAMVSAVFPGFTIFYAEDEPYNNEIEYSPDDTVSTLYSARMAGVKRTYYIGNGLSNQIPIPEFVKDDERLIKEFAEFAGVTFRTFSKHPLYIKAEYLERYINVIDAFVRLAACHVYRPAEVIEGFSPALEYEFEPFSDLAVTIIKWLAAHIPTEARNVFVDYLANKKCYYEVYVELVQFIHEYLTEQDNTAKFEL